MVAHLNYTDTEFLNVNWDYVLVASGNTVDEMWDKFTSLITEGMNAFVPKHLHRSINSKKKFQPFNADLRHLVHRKHRLWNHWIKSRNDQVYKEYKIVRNKVKRETVKLIQKEQAKISAECKSNPKRFWKYVNSKTINKNNVSDLNGRMIKEMRGQLRQTVIKHIL